MVDEHADGAAEQAQGVARFAGMETVYDPETFRLLYARGIDEGWRCLEVGGGGGSIAKWLCRRVGSSGRVVVTDTDISQLEGIEEPNLEVDRHDVVVDPIPERVFHLVHARLVLGEIPQRQTALDRLAESLRTGGWLVVEDLDRTSLAPDTDDETAAALFAKVQDAVSQVMTVAGLDPQYGRRLYRSLIAVGLSDVVARGGSQAYAGGSPGAELVRQELQQLRGQLLSGGLLSAEEIDGCIALLADPEFVFMSATLVTAWGRRPAAS